jgi:predicted NAD-dependent protein-ADP-ribosyltransferase YbiA (DUF1768 family)
MNRKLDTDTQVFFYTGDRELIEDSWRDSYWGWGEDHKGRNWLGKLWMEVREELRDSFSR